MFKKFFKGVKSAGLWMYRAGMWGYNKYDNLPEDQKDQLEEGVEKAVKKFFEKKKEK